MARPVCQFLLNHWTPDLYFPFLTWRRGPKRISWLAAIAGAFVGTYSHFFLGSIMHSDMQPPAPFSDANALLHVISVGSLHLVCVLEGVGDALVLFAIFILRRGPHVNRRAYCQVHRSHGSFAASMAP